MRRNFIVIVILVFLLSLGAGVIVWSEKRLSALNADSISLQHKQNEAKKRLNIAENEASINTATWTKYCDTVTGFCFSYPSDWKFEDFTIKYPDYILTHVGVTNPEQTVQIEYHDPLTKDGGTKSEHVVDKATIKVADEALILIGSYPVASGIYKPEYYLTMGEYSTNATPGQLHVGSINPIFNIGGYSSLSLYMRKSPELTSEAQAKAWFESVQGKTVKTIMSSFGQ